MRGEYPEIQEKYDDLLAYIHQLYQVGELSGFSHSKLLSLLHAYINTIEEIFGKVASGIAIEIYKQERKQDE